MQFAACQHRLEHVACVHAAFGTASTHDGVKLVQEQQNAPLTVRDFLEDGLEALFKLTPELSPCDETANVKCNERLITQALWHITVDDALGQPLRDSGFTHTRLTNEYRVVFGAAANYMDKAANFLVAANHGVKFAVARSVGQVAPELLQALEGAFRVFTRHALTATHGLKRVHDGVFGHALLVEDAPDVIIFNEGQQQMFRADVVVAHLLGDALGIVKDVECSTAQRNLHAAAAAHTRVHAHLTVHFRQDGGVTGTDFGNDLRNQAVVLLHKGNHDVGGFDGVVVAIRGKGLRFDERVLCFVGVFFEVHRRLVSVRFSLPIECSLSCL